MNTREKFYAIRDALNDEGQLQLMARPRLEETVYEVYNLPQIKEALDAWASFRWSQIPNDLRADIAYLVTVPSVPADHFHRMQSRLQQFSSNEFVQAEPMRVLEDAVADFGDQLFQMQVQLKASIQETLESAARAISLPESIVVEGSISEPRFGNGSLDIFWLIPESQARALWTLAMYCWQEIKALLSDPATAHVWSVIDKQPDHDPETVRNIKRDYIQTVFGADNTLARACEAAQIDIGNVQSLAVEIASIETKEDVTFQWPLGWRKRKEHVMHGVSVQIRSEQMAIPDHLTETVFDAIKFMHNESETPDPQISTSDAEAPQEN